MLRRKMTEKLIEWKKDPKKKALLVRGARQVGKTYSIEDFGKRNMGRTSTSTSKETPLTHPYLQVTRTLIP